MVHGEWSKIIGWSVEKRLKLIKDHIKRWNKKSFKDIDRNLRLDEQWFQILDKIADTRELTNSELQQLSTYHSSVRKWRMRKGQLLRQYSRCKNLTQKDHNTKYFHMLASMNHRRNIIRDIQIGDQIISRVEAIQRSIREFYKQSYA